MQLKLIHTLRHDPAVYVIKCDKTGDAYVGQTTELVRRLRGHRASLRRGDHWCERMQADYNVHGPETFSVEVLEYVEWDHTVDPTALLREREHHFIKLLRPTYNRFGQNMHTINIHLPEHILKELVQVSARYDSTSAYVRKLLEHFINNGGLPLIPA